MPQAFGRLLSRLSVGRKLMLIYLLDLSAVIFVSTILINEKFIAIDFARKEVRGNAYLQGLSGALRPGGTIVEGTAGNTGIGLAVIGGALGYRTVIVMPETQSQEMMDTLRALGAELVLVPSTSYANPGQ